MSGANLGTAFTTDNLIPSADILNKAWLRISKELQDLLRHGLLPEFTPADGTGFVFGGLDCARVGLLDKTEVDPGAGFIFDSSVGSRTHPSVDAAGTALSAWGAVIFDAPIQADHSAPHPSLDRIDVVTVKATPGTDVEESVLVFGSAIPENADTQTGPTLLVTVTEGMQAPSPVAPTAPAGEILLCEVLVESAAGGGSFTYTDKRNWLGLATKSGGVNGVFKIVSDTPFGQMMHFEDRSLGLTHAIQMSADSMLKFFRESPDGSVKEHGGDMFPRMSIFDRKWTRTASWDKCGLNPDAHVIDPTDFFVVREGINPGSGVPFRGLNVRHDDLTAGLFIRAGLSFDMDGLCGLRPDAITLDWEIVTALDAGNGEVLEAGIHFWDASAATLIDIGDVPLLALSNAVGDHLDTIALTADPPLIDDGDVLFVFIKQTWSATAAVNGDVYFRAATCRFKEGQA